MPLVNLDVPQGQLAEKYMRESVFVQHRKDGAPPDDYLLKTELARVELQTEKHLLQIIQTFCKADRLEAALDAVLLLSQPASLVAASKIAGFFTLPALQERVDLLQQMREESGDPEAAAAKRQSKWAHLADDRYITSNGSGSAGAGFGGPANAAASLFGPGSADAFGSSRKSFGTPAGTQMSSTSARKKRKSVADASESAAAGFPGSDDVEPNAFDDELEYADVQVDSSPKRMRLDSEEVLEEDETPVQAPPKKGEPAETPETPALSPAH